MRYTGHAGFALRICRVTGYRFVNCLTGLLPHGRGSAAFFYHTSDDTFYFKPIVQVLLKRLSMTIIVPLIA